MENPMSLSPTAKRWAELVLALDQSNLTSREFAALHNVKASSLSWWRSRFRGSLTSRAFVAVDLPAVLAPPKSKPALRLEFAERPVVLSIPRDADLAWVRAVVDALS